MNSTTLAILTLPALCLVVVFIVLLVWAAQTVTVKVNKREAWQAFAQAIGGEFVPAALGQPDQVVGRVAHWPLYLDTYVAGDGRGLTDYTRLRAFYPPRNHFEFSLISKGVQRNAMADRYSKLHDMNAVALGLSGDLLARSTDEVVARAFLSDDELRRLIADLPNPLDLEVRRRRHWRSGGVSASIYEVHLQQAGIVTDVERLKALYALLVAALTQLQRQGVAGESFADPTGSTDG